MDIHHVYYWDVQLFCNQALECANVFNAAFARHLALREIEECKAGERKLPMLGKVYPGGYAIVRRERKESTVSFRQ